MKPVLFVTGHAPFDRVGAFAALHEREDVEFALFGGRLRHGALPPAPASLPFPHRLVRQRDPAMLIAAGRYRAVVCSAAGRVALPATWAGARRAHLPLILWTALWAHPRSAAHALSYLALARLYRSAEAVVTYGPHVSAYVRARGARNVHIAPQSVDNQFWSSPAVEPPADPRWPAGAALRLLFVGRPAREKGIEVLLEAWSRSGLAQDGAALVLAGVGAGADAGRGAAGVVAFDPVPPQELRNFYAAADVLVLPSIPTGTFREPWGLVANEAMNRGLPVIATDAVGAAAGGLVRDGVNGLVVPASDAGALAGAMRQLFDEPGLRAQLGREAVGDVLAYNHDAWAHGFSQALASLSLSRCRW